MYNMEIDCKLECIRRRHCLEYITEFRKRYPYVNIMCMHRLLWGENDYNMTVEENWKKCAHDCKWVYTTKYIVTSK